MTLFHDLSLLPPDPILGLTQTFLADPRKHKVNLGVGVYKDSEGRSYVLESIRKAEREIFEEKLTKDYGPIEGNPAFREESVKLVFGEPGAVCLQALGGTGALRVGAALLDLAGAKDVHVSEQNWPNHMGIFTQAGFKVEKYPYYRAGKVDFEAMKRYLEGLPKGSVVILQGSCHNPTGADLTKEQWKELSQLMLKKGLIPFFDMAYIGFGGTVEEDTFAPRLFAKEGHQFPVALSYSKNLGLYGERAGALLIVTDRPDEVMSHAKQIIRAQYSNPPLHTGRVAAKALTDYYGEWQEELKNMRVRIQGMRAAFAAGLMTRLNGRDMSFLEKQKGLFSLLGLSQEQVVRLRDEFAIHMPMSGRINFAGLTGKNMEYVIESVASLI